MSALDSLPAQLRSRDSVVSMAQSLDRTRQQLAETRREAKRGPSVVKVALPSLGGAFLAGIADSRMPKIMGGNVQTSAAAAIAGITAAWFTGSEMLMFGSIGALAPQAYLAGVRSQGFELAIVESDKPQPEPAPNPAS